MPFTFAHPAIVIPAKKLNKYIDFTAIILGSMAPDFEYFIRNKPLGLIGHTLSGFIYFNLPLCLVIAFLFHYIVKRPLILNMPKPINVWYFDFAMEKWSIKSIKEFLIFCYSSILGMITHVFWDNFTHKGAYFVNKITFLTNHINILNHKIYIYKILQHGSTLIGLLVIGIYLYFIRSKRYYNRNQVSTKNKILYYLSILIFCIIFTYYKTFYLMGSMSISNIGAYIVILINGFLLGIVFASLIFRKIC